MTWRIVTFSVVALSGLLMLLMWIGFQRRIKALTALSAKGAKGGEGPSEASLRDAVTELYNRKHLLQRLQENIARCDRKKEKLALILWDIDGFVDFNNRFGQNEGDKLLKKVAETLKKAIRVYDEAFRCGPDEFCTILIPGDQKIATEVTQRVSQTMAKNLFGEAAYADQRFSLTSGVVFYPSENKLPEALLHAAGQALYKSRVS